MAYLEQVLRTDERTYTAAQLAEKLVQDRQIHLSPGHLREVLEKRGVIWKRTRHRHRHRQEPAQRATKQADLYMLAMAAAAGDIDLFYLDESGCCQWSAVSYSYYFRGEQKRQEKTAKRGRRLSILSLWQPFVTFVYGLVFGAMKSENDIAMMAVQT